MEPISANYQLDLLPLPRMCAPLESRHEEIAFLPRLLRRRLDRLRADGGGDVCAAHRRGTDAEMHEDLRTHVLADVGDRAQAPVFGRLRARQGGVLDVLGPDPEDHLPADKLLQRGPLCP